MAPQGGYPEHEAANERHTEESCREAEDTERDVERNDKHHDARDRPASSSHDCPPLRFEASDA
jgi:hypothetical protein